MVWSVSLCVNLRIERVHLVGENEQLKAEVAMLKEELRIKNAQLDRIPGLLQIPLWVRDLLHILDAYHKRASLIEDLHFSAGCGIHSIRALASRFIGFLPLFAV